MDIVYNEFEVGDVVQVVSEPYRKCPFSWVRDMSEYLGQTVTICEKIWSSVRKTYSYHIKEDDNSFSWCGNCFVAIEPDFEVEDDRAILELLGI